MKLDTQGPIVPVVAIDGPVGSGKGTISRQVANSLGWHLLDSGALYRLVALASMKLGVAKNEEKYIATLARTLVVKFDSDQAGNARIFLDGENVTTDIRTEECSRVASEVASFSSVRTALLELQRTFRKNPGLVADGRDIGSTIFPDAFLKIYLTASIEERVKRRYKQLKHKGINVSLPTLLRDIEDRDRRDVKRSVAPLRLAGDAKFLDSSGLSIEEVTQTILGWISELFKEN